MHTGFWDAGFSWQRATIWQLLLEMMRATAAEAATPPRKAFSLVEIETAVRETELVQTDFFLEIFPEMSFQAWGIKRLYYCYQVRQEEAFFCIVNDFSFAFWVQLLREENALERLVAIKHRFVNHFKSVKKSLKHFKLWAWAKHTVRNVHFLTAI